MNIFSLPGRILLLSYLLIAAVQAPGQNSSRILGEVGRWPGYTRGGAASDVAIVGTRAYLLAWNGGLRILDIADPANPRVLGDAASGFSSSAIQVVGNLAYVASASEGLQIFDVSDPSHLVLTGSFKLSASSLKIVNNIAYMGVSTGLSILDVTNPAQPALLGSIALNDSARAVEVAGATAYVAVTLVVYVVDVTDPRAPRVKGSLPNPYAGEIAVIGNRLFVAVNEGLRIYEGSTLVSTVPTGGARSVQVNGNFAFVAGAYVSGYSGPALTVVDISAAPRITGTYTSDPANRVRVAGDLIFLATAAGLEILQARQPENWTYPPVYPTSRPAVEIAVSNDRIYVAEGIGGLQIFDALQTPPALLGKYTNAAPIQGVKVRDGIAYLRLGTGGVQISDVRDPAAPKDLASYSPVDSYEIELSGPLAYIAHTNGLLILNVIDPSAPRAVGAYATSRPVFDVKITEKIAFLAVPDEGVLVLDVSNPAAPSLMGRYETRTWPYGLSVEGSVLYVGESDFIFEIVDIATPSKPTLLTQLQVGTASRALGVFGRPFIFGQTACMLTRNNELHVFDVSNPRKPLFKGAYAGVGDSMQIVGTNAYVTRGSSGFMVVDLTRSSGPSRVSEHSLLGSSADVKIGGGKAYVADSEAGLQIVDVANPARPSLAGHVDFFYPVRTLALADTTAFVCSDNLYFVDVADPQKPVVLGKYDGSFSAAQSVGNLLYLLGDNFRILDVSNGAKPALLGSWEISSPEHMQVAGSRALVSSYLFPSNLVSILDVGDPRAPVKIGEIGVRMVSGLAFEGNFAYLAAGDSFQIWDISSVRSPVRRSSYPLDPPLSSVAVRGSRAYVAAREQGVFVFDVSNPARPLKIGEYNVRGVQNLTAVGNTVYVAAGPEGLRILGEPLRLSIAASQLGGARAVNFSGGLGIPIILGSSGNLRDWSPVWTNNGAAQYLDPRGALFQRQFYRGRQ